MNYNVELYFENGMYCAYIMCEDYGDSGYSIVAQTEAERAERIGEYFLNCEIDEEYDEDDDE